MLIPYFSSLRFAWDTFLKYVCKITKKKKAQTQRYRHLLPDGTVLPIFCLQHREKVPKGQSHYHLLSSIISRNCLFYYIHPQCYFINWRDNLSGRNTSTINCFSKFHKHSHNKEIIMLHSYLRNPIKQPP